jgi:hypothetical protein
MNNINEWSLLVRHTVDEREVLRAWRDLFKGNAAGPETLAKAETLLDGLSGESPLHLRLANELLELQKGSVVVEKKRPARRKVT